MPYHRTIAACSLVLGGVCLFSSVAPAGDEARKDLARLQGRWRAVSQESVKGNKGAKKGQPPSGKPDMIIQGNKIISPAEKLGLPFTLNVTKNPKRIKMTIRYALGGNKFKDVEYYSLYTFEGD